MSIKNLLLRIARSGIGGGLVCFCFRYCAGVVPLKIIAKSEKFVMVQHPQPAGKLHYIIVPRFRAADISALLARDDDWSAFAGFVGENVSFDEVSLCCNYGVRQEVGQVHFHVMEKKALQVKDGADVEEYSIGLRRVRFSARGNINIDRGDLPGTDFLRDVINEGKTKFPYGFSIIFD